MSAAALYACSADEAGSLPVASRTTSAAFCFASSNFWPAASPLLAPEPPCNEDTGKVG